MKFFKITVLTLVLMLVFFIIKPNKLPKHTPKSISLVFIKANKKLGLHKTHTDHDSKKNQPKPSNVYAHKNKQGEIVFSDVKKTGHAKKHQIDSAKHNFIDMQSSKKTKKEITENTSTLDAVLDPVNSINKEATKNVEKMREAKRQKLAKQGI